MLAVTKVLLLGLLVTTAPQNNNNYTLPDGFMLGVASAAYQVEGGWNETGKGVSNWDHLVHEHPDFIVDGSNGDVTDNSYNMWREDIAMLKELGVDFYRFSISWSRLMPIGEANNIYKINMAGIQYYNVLINQLVANDIQPMVTMFNWDLPQWLEEMGGWMNDIMIDYFEDYARCLYANFGTRVKWWITFNDPLATASGYASYAQIAPAINKHGVGDYLAIHHMLMAHARAYHIYQNEFRDNQKGKISIGLSADWEEPLSNSTEDIEAAERALQFKIGMFAHPIYYGDYPPIVKERVNNNSIIEGRPHSRFPKFTEEMIQYINGTSDYFAINYFTSHLVSSNETGENPSIQRDIGVVESFDDTWATSASSWLRVVPWGLRKVINWVYNEYNAPAIIITANGYSDNGTLEDTDRISYHTNHLIEVLNAVYEDGCNVTGYAAWSVMDSFEWNAGYTEKFGLYSVNFSDPKRTRTPKASAVFFQQIVTTRQVPTDYLNATDFSGWEYVYDDMS